MRNLAAIIALLLATTFIHADILTLQDGTKLEGYVKPTHGGYVVTSADGKVTRVDGSKVESIRLGKSDGIDPKLAAPDRLASLRRSVESLSDPKQVIDRYKQFIEMNKGTLSADEA